jgi:periplasmic protein TonB
MEVKKNIRADLENKKGLFFQIGLLIVLALLLLAFEWTSKPKEIELIGQLEDLQIDEERIPITRQEQEPIAPQPPKIIEQLNIVDDNVEIDEVDFESMEADANMSVDFIPFVGNEEETEEDEIFFIVEDMPKFNGGDKEEFRKFIQENLYYPEIARQHGIEGRVFVQFAVNTKGEICDVIVIRGIDPALDKEAVRVIKSSPKWTPGKQRGRPVKVQFTFPIVFVLN